MWKMTDVTWHVTCDHNCDDDDDNQLFLSEYIGCNKYFLSIWLQPITQLFSLLIWYIDSKQYPYFKWDVFINYVSIFCLLLGMLTLVFKTVDNVVSVWFEVLLLLFQFVNFTNIMSQNIPSHKKEAEFALAALMEIPSQYKATIGLDILGYSCTFLYSGLWFCCTKISILPCMFCFGNYWTEILANTDQI